MSCTGFGKCTLDSLVDVRALDITEEDGLVSCIHDREILDVFQILDGDTDFDPTCFPISKVVPAIRTFVDGVEGFREVGLDNLPSPCPGEVGKVALLLSVLVAVDGIERCKSGLLHKQLGYKGLNIYSKSRPPELENGSETDFLGFWKRVLCTGTPLLVIEKECFTAKSH